jgi:hypothetical protein
MNQRPYHTLPFSVWRLPRRIGIIVKHFVWRRTLVMASRFTDKFLELCDDSCLRRRFFFVFHSVIGSCRRRGFTYIMIPSISISLNAVPWIRTSYRRRSILFQSRKRQTRRQTNSTNAMCTTIFPPPHRSNKSGMAANTPYEIIRTKSKTNRAAVVV